MEFTCCFRATSVHFTIAQSPDARSWWTVSQRRRNLSRPGRNTVRRHIKLSVSEIRRWTSRRNHAKRALQFRASIFRKGARVSIPRQSRGLYGGWPHKGALSPPPGRDPSPPQQAERGAPHLVPRPPSPQGRGKNHQQRAARRQQHCPLRGERVAAMRRRGPHALLVVGVRGLVPCPTCRSRLTSTASPAEPGGLPAD